jgi:DNA-binding NarL/FixJ family response regulator
MSSLREMTDRTARPVRTVRHLSPSTIKTHLQRLYERLEVSDRAAAVAEGMRRGLIE